MLAYLFLVLAIAYRFALPHPWAFTMTAPLLFFGARGSRRQMWVPLAAFCVVDLALNKFVYSYPFTWDLLVTWGWYAAILWLGSGLRTNSKALRVIGAAATSSISFFLLSNGATWLASNMYPKDFGGLMAAYIAGVPFFREALVGDLVATAVMFATPVALHALASMLRQRDGASAA